MKKNRYILHCDLDCFYAAVEIRDNPQFKGKPVIIGADPKKGKGRGVISTCSYEARKFGLHSGMPISQAYKKCPHGIYLRPNYMKYSQVSKYVMKIIKKYSESFQKVGSDEAYLDITDLSTNLKVVKQIAKKIQNEIYKKVGITISIGCAPTKSLAKIASDYNKPNGITIFTTENYKDILKDMDITRIPGIGKKSKIYFNKRGINKIGDLIDKSIYEMMELFGNHGKWIWQVLNCSDKRKVKEFHKVRKSISKEWTFYKDIKNFNMILFNLDEINKKIHKVLYKKNISYRTITLKIRFDNYQTFTRSKTISYPICDKKKVLSIILNLYNEFLNISKKIRLLGIKLSNFERSIKSRQLTLIDYKNNKIKLGDSSLAN